MCYTRSVNPDNKGRATLVSIITTPLGFFALSLLIVEGFIGIILIGSSVSGTDNALSGGQKFGGMLIGAGLFLLVVGVVTILVWNKPENLTFGEKSHLERRKTQGDPDNLFTERELKARPKVEA